MGCHIVKRLIIALATALIASPVMAQSPIPPPDAVSRQVTIGIICLPTPSRMIDVLGERFGEAVVASGVLSPDSGFIVFSNKDRTSSSIVISKPGGTCLVWSGRSAEGMAFILAVEPIEYPEPLPPMPDGTET